MSCLEQFDWPKVEKFGVAIGVYEVGDEVLYIHIVCDTRRDMQTLLVNRILRMTKK